MVTPQSSVICKTCSSEYLCLNELGTHIEHHEFDCGVGIVTWHCKNNGCLETLGIQFIGTLNWDYPNWGGDFDNFFILGYNCKSCGSNGGKIGWDNWLGKNHNFTYFQVSCVDCHFEPPEFCGIVPHEGGIKLPSTIQIETIREQPGLKVLHNDICDRLGREDLKEL
jgi:hypothetical protein